MILSGPTKGGATLKSEYTELTADRYGCKFFAKNLAAKALPRDVLNTVQGCAKKRVATRFDTKGQKLPKIGRVRRHSGKQARAC